MQLYKFIEPFLYPFSLAFVLAFICVFFLEKTQIFEKFIGIGSDNTVVGGK